MDTQICQPKLQVTEEFEVVGSGEMPTEPCQIGEWWVVPAEQYKGKVPKEAQQKLFSIINQGLKIKGVLIADDIREIEQKKEQEKKKKEMIQKAALAGIAALAAPAIGMGLGLAAIVFGLCAYDPILIAVSEDGRYICCGTWFDA